ncbi:hypothetical protein [Bifidobacterium olomucense]|uniref:Uncharacterized protein n=1 Tax=Bifidobacterium olomucense TaxID=2675324 RepID=A0A7Y0EW25_9BIFI|nr:hypothetical protein [Bifidobacterium sp. DSM 109959]NMM97484.1 hypothetical protein [Bifidobacterium sp. DSM 109959]
MGHLLIIDMLPTYGLLFYVLVSVCVLVLLHGLRKTSPDQRRLRSVTAATLVVSWVCALFAALVYVMAAPASQPDMTDFYVMYRPASLGVLLVLFLAQVGYGIRAIRR